MILIFILRRTSSMRKPTQKEFILLAAKHYRNKRCLTYSEFEDDILRFSYIKRLINRIIRGKSVDLRLLLNHFILLYNVFDDDGLYHIFIKEYNDEQLSCIKSFGIFLNHMTTDTMPLIKENEQIIEDLNK